MDVHKTFHEGFANDILLFRSYGRSTWFRKYAFIGVEVISYKNPLKRMVLYFLYFVYITFIMTNNSLTY